MGASASAAGRLLGVSVSEAVRILNERHEAWRLDRHAVGKALREGRISGGSLGSLEADLASHICLEPWCPRVAVGVSGGCAAHGHVFLGAGAADVPRTEKTKKAIS